MGLCILVTFASACTALSPAQWAKVNNLNPPPSSGTGQRVGTAASSIAYNSTGTLDIQYTFAAVTSAQIQFGVTRYQTAARASTITLNQIDNPTLFAYLADLILGKVTVTPATCAAAVSNSLTFNYSGSTASIACPVAPDASQPSMAFVDVNQYVQNHL